MKSPKWCVTEYMNYKFGLILSQKVANVGFYKCRVLREDGLIKDCLLLSDEIVSSDHLKIG